MRAQRITRENSGLDHKEWRKLKSLKSPAKVQDFLNSLKFDFAPGEKIDRSVRGTLKAGKTDCAGGAILAAAALWAQGRPPLLLDLVTDPADYDHVVALFYEDLPGGHNLRPRRLWGALSKTNHAVLRYREPIYQSVRELVMSFFHEYFLSNGRKTLRSYSRPFDLSRQGTEWLTDKEAVVEAIYRLDHSRHADILTPKQVRRLRRADKIEITAGEIVEYK